MNRRHFMTRAAGVLAGATAWASARAADAPTPAIVKVVKTEAEWRKVLTPAQFSVLRQEGTERPFSSPLNDEKHKGTFVCAGCDLPLFESRDEVRQRHRLAELLRPHPGRGRRPARLEAHRAAHRVSLRPLRWPSGPRVRRRSEAYRPALLQQRCRAEIHSGVIGVTRGAPAPAAPSRGRASSRVTSLPRVHARELLDARRGRERVHVGAHRVGAAALGHAEMGSANAATCGRWVTHITCRRAPSPCSSLPTVAATVPPMPASTSSKISVGTVVDFARHDGDRQREARQLAARRDPRERAERLLRVARDAKLDLLLPEAAGTASGSSATSKRPPAIASSCIVAVTRCASSLAANWRLFVSSIGDARAARPRSRHALRSVAMSADSAIAASRACVSASSCGRPSGRTR